jgi:hypothetical protein
MKRAILLTRGQRVRYSGGASKEVGFCSLNGAVMSRLASDSDSGFFTSDAPNTEARTGKPQGLPVLHRSANLVSGFHPHFAVREEVTKPLLEHHHD